LAKQRWLLAPLAPPEQDLPAGPAPAVRPLAALVWMQGTYDLILFRNFDKSQKAPGGNERYLMGLLIRSTNKDDLVSIQETQKNGVY